MPKLTIGNKLGDSLTCPQPPPAKKIHKGGNQVLEKYYSAGDICPPAIINIFFQ